MFLAAACVLAQGQDVEINPAKQTPMAPQSRSTSIKPYHSITSRQRLSWFLDSTVGPETLTVGLLSAGIGTGRNAPKEYGSHWEGFGKRYAMGRIRNVVLMTFLAHNREGALMPAYARFTATAGNNFLSNTWRADSEANNRDAAIRTLYGFLGLMGKNAFTEFWPDIKASVFHRKD